MNSANDTRCLDLCDVTMSGWIIEEPSKSKVDKKNLVRQLANT
jgi:hypothetical protein